MTSARGPATPASLAQRRRSAHPQRRQIKIEDRLLLDSAVAILLSERHDLSHDLDVEAVRLGLAVDVLDVAGERFLLLFEALDPLDEGAQMAGVDLARADRFVSVAFAIFML